MNPFLVLYFLLTLLPPNFNPLITLERTLDEPLYKIRSTFNKNLVQVKPKDNYTIVLVGDSMTSLLGEEELKNNLKEFYPNKEIKVLNYGIGSTTIETVPERLINGVIKGDSSLNPLLSYNPDLIILESSGNNPINLPTDAGLKKQEEILDQIIQIVRSKSPEVKIVFAATLYPDKENYGRNVLGINKFVSSEISSEDLKNQGEIRILYIENHISYARENNIPLINIFDKSKDKVGEYIDKIDFIHPSKKGISFVNQEIADFIYQNRILPL